MSERRSESADILVVHELRRRVNAERDMRMIFFMIIGGLGQR